MRKVAILVSILSLAVTWTSCQRERGGNLADLRKLADSATARSQQLLFQKVSTAMSQGGAAHALEFCQVQAIPITDSLSRSFELDLQRISDKNRNPNNRFRTPKDRSIFETFKQSPKLKDTILMENGHPIYYKRIDLGMVNCLKCHGKPNVDLEPKTLELIRDLYPMDKAVDYGLNDLRGMWKVYFSKQ